MPRPWTAIRWLAAAYSYVFGAGMAGAIAWAFLRDGAIVIAGGPRHAMGPLSAAMLALWLLSVVITGWHGMERESAE